MFDFLELPPNSFPHAIVINTGPIDDCFSNVGYRKLEYRFIKFETKMLKNVSFYQPCSVVNHPGPDIPFTRTIEYKHLLNQNSPHTTIVSETSCSDGDPYYPVPNQRNLELYSRYQKMAEKQKNIHSVGRLANFKYFNMDEAILNALEYYDSHLAE